MSATQRERLAKLARRTTTVEVGGNSLMLLDYLTEILDSAETLRASTVDQAREQGESWQTIATSIGTSKQAAQQRYGKKPTGPAPDLETTLPGL